MKNCYDHLTLPQLKQLFGVVCGSLGYIEEPMLYREEQTTAAAEIVKAIDHLQKMLNGFVEL